MYEIKVRLSTAGTPAEFAAILKKTEELALDVQDGSPVEVLSVAPSWINVRYYKRTFPEDYLPALFKAGFQPTGEIWWFKEYLGE